MADSVDYKKKFVKSVEEWKSLRDKLISQEKLDEEGYPTNASIELIEKWYFSDVRGWFDFIKSIWYYSSWGWKEQDEPSEHHKDKTVKRYYISTAGWSGNEHIIRAMQKNAMMWHLNWVQSRRGGHHIFELKEFDV